MELNSFIILDLHEKSYVQLESHIRFDTEALMGETIERAEPTFEYCN